MISTKRCRLMVCARDKSLSEVLLRNNKQLAGPYDFLPVTESGEPLDRIIGLFHAAKFSNDRQGDETVGKHCEPISEDHLIGADASILDFILDADRKPCRLVVSGSNIVGLVSLSDLQKLPVRAALFALITGLEIAMYGAIERARENDEDWDWKCHLSEGRTQKIDEKISKSHDGDGFVDELLFTEFCDKRDILLEGFQLPESKAAFKRKLEHIQNLRDSLAHANEYAASRKDAEHVCKVVRDLLKLRNKIGNLQLAA